MGFSGHKHQKGEKILTICDGNGNIVAPLVVESVNRHDDVLLDESLMNLQDIALEIHLDLSGKYLTLDSGFDSALNVKLIEYLGLIPVIKPNLRGLKDETRINARLDAFERVKDVYEKRYSIERCFAWEDTYRKLVIRYETLQATFMGFRYLAFSMINFRSIFKNKRGET